MGRLLPKTFETKLEPMTIQRADCDCPHCRKGSLPGHGALGMQRMASNAP